jgi:ribose 5-phosphate isomerase B
MTIHVASDHAGFELKKELIHHLKEYNWRDYGPFDTVSVDYPDFAKKVCEALRNSEKDYGLLICGSGQGMCMSANKYPFIRAALCWNSEVARLARAHNNANVLCLGARIIDFETATQILKTFCSTSFEGGRHELRVNKIGIK